MLSIASAVSLVMFTIPGKKKNNRSSHRMQSMTKQHESGELSRLSDRRISLSTSAGGRPDTICGAAPATRRSRDVAGKRYVLSRGGADGGRRTRLFLTTYAADEQRRLTLGCTGKHEKKKEQSEEGGKGGRGVCVWVVCSGRDGGVDKSGVWTTGYRGGQGRRAALAVDVVPTARHCLQAVQPGRQRVLVLHVVAIGQAATHL